MKPQSPIAEIMERMISELVKKQSEAFKADLIPKLRYYGLDVDENNFLEFAKRLTRVEVSPQEYEIYLDYMTEKKFLVRYNERVEFKQEGNKFIAIMGGV